MQLPSFSFAFMDWIAARVAATGGQLVAGAVFDERQKDFAASVAYAVQEGVGHCIGISLASADRVQKESPDDTLHEVSCSVMLVRSTLDATLSIAEAVNLAEALYLTFSAAHWRGTPGSERPDVTADAYRAEVRPADGLLTITFTVSTILNLDINTH